MNIFHSDHVWIWLWAHDTNSVTEWTMFGIPLYACMYMGVGLNIHIHMCVCMQRSEVYFDIVPISCPSSLLRWGLSLSKLAGVAAQQTPCCVAYTVCAPSEKVGIIVTHYNVFISLFNYTFWWVSRCFYLLIQLHILVSSGIEFRPSFLHST